MPVNFKHRYNDFESVENLNIGRLSSSGNLTNEEVQRLERIRENWNFYEGYHWEGIDDEDSPQVTFNYCRTFIDKFVSFELGDGFYIETTEGLDKIAVTNGDQKIDTNKDLNKDGVITPEEALSPSQLTERTVFDFLEKVWDYNDRDSFIEEIGQTKSITGEAWVKVQYVAPEDLDDPFGEYPNGKIRLSVTPTQYVFPEFDQHDTKKLNTLLIMYPIERREQTGILKNRTRIKTIIYKEYWTKDEIKVYEDEKEIDSMKNPYNMIPYVQIKNLAVAGRTRGLSDLDDLIPLNMELNMKKSDCSEIIDYHSAPITLVYGAKIGNLEKGANKVWGGLPKDSKVENLSLSGDLLASQSYISDTKTAMCEIGGVPETALGGASAISNTSGVALQYMNAPLIDKTKTKRNLTKNGLQKVNKLILLISLMEGLIEKPEEISIAEFVRNTVTIPDTLPKDTMLELTQIQLEMQLGLECRHGALKRLGREDIQSKLDEVDKERAEHPEYFGGSEEQTSVNAGGMMNGETPIETVRKEITGSNGMTTQF